VISFIASLLRDLHPEAPELGEPLDDARRHLALAVDRVRVDLLDQEALELLHEVPEPGPFGGRLGEGVDEIEPEPAEEDLLQERGSLPLGFAGFLGHLSRFGLADGPAGLLHTVANFTARAAIPERRL
jgi:hypothetical protein